MELVLGQQSSPSSGSAPETPTPEPPSIIPDPPISTLTPEPSTPSPVLTPDPPAAQPEAPDPPTENTSAEPEVEDEDQVKFLLDFTLLSLVTQGRLCYKLGSVSVCSGSDLGSRGATGYRSQGVSV